MNQPDQQSQSPKVTSFAYDEAYQKIMLEVYRESKRVAEDNPSYLRVHLVKQLIEEAFQRLSQKPKQDTIVLDVGCSVGTFAIECAKMGFNAHGVDFDEQAIKIARSLNIEEKTRAQFHVMDVSDWTHDFPPVDIAICADIFEHLHDDELGSFLVGLRKNLSKDGLLVFHTLPQEYEYLLWKKRKDSEVYDLRWVFEPFKFLSDKYFTRLVRIAALTYDILRIAVKGETFKEHIKQTAHPNPLTKPRLIDILHRAGYDIISIETCSWAGLMPDRLADFWKSHTITHRSIYGIVRAITPTSASK
jgi:2-polyprenyl-3-methyl-5-hydroxy-6-metoxy-1,4-benzoquinol methylase